ncbi:hypothetical protein DICPUDRAFT_86304 [Dictyostelium purpureum]|uniref:NadR/Ttd14 AAA domain-containing protein n=1 Tax=Dictyostelium purpureum TaxID=5786 RepID=F0ZAT9_DICPU|nr:uncharacterized protein DICPUDRAFT_86304 [Dictyostelium purpureum]EGC38977.1 hypothetical protein DICPUDRAFT_86304 [Dictyostelium purpureum]|eukprot:XP_003284542.1 hypothetical protein DICPUDRAFT_86304 [Dictyostelium purpureum]
MKTKKICIIGGESTFKTTLSKNLSKYFDCLWSEEFARIYFKDRDFDRYPFCDEDFINVCKGQIEIENNCLEKKPKYLICDTCPLITLIWSDTLIGKYSTKILEYVNKSNYDLYLLLDYNTKWVHDELRLIPEEKERELFQLKLIEKCNELSIHYHHLFGSYEERERMAIEIIEKTFVN